MRKCKIVTSGVSSEYVLSELSSYLRNSGYEVIEIDFANVTENSVPLLQQLSSEDVVYITSAHMNLSLSGLAFLGSKLPEYYPYCLAPIEIIPILKPRTTIYIPHDLLTPYGDANLKEVRFLDLMDHILAPTMQDTFALSATLPSTTQVHFAGWIKYTDREIFHTDKIKTLLFISNIEYLKDKYGVEGTVEYFKPFLAKDVYVKLPAWNNVEKFEQAVRDNSDATVISSSVSSIELIKQAEVVVCNGASSIHAESVLMGKPTVCLVDDELMPAEEQIPKLRHLSNIYFHDYTSKLPLPVDFLNELKEYRVMRTLQPFNFKMVCEIIENVNYD